MFSAFSVPPSIDKLLLNILSHNINHTQHNIELSFSRSKSLKLNLKMNPKIEIDQENLFLFASFPWEIKNVLICSLTCWKIEFNRQIILSSSRENSLKIISPKFILRHHNYISYCFRWFIIIPTYLNSYKMLSPDVCLFTIYVLFKPMLTYWGK